MMNLRNLDMLRGLLALSVVIGHARTLLWMSWSEWRQEDHHLLSQVLAGGTALFGFGHQMVLIFFVLSGFFIHLRAALLLRDGGKSYFDCREYLARRARRIFPPYYAALLFTMAVDALGVVLFPTFYSGQSGDPLIDSMVRGSGFSVANVCPALFAQPTLLGDTLTGNGPLWSIQREVFYYALYPIFMLVWLRSRWLAYALGFGYGLVCCFTDNAAGWFTTTVGNYPIWLMGALLAEMMVRGKFIALGGWWQPCCGSLIALVLLFSTRLVPTESRWVVVVVAMLLGMFTLVSVERMPATVLNSVLGRGLEWIGVRSYSLYIFHMPLLIFGSAWIFSVHGSRPSHGWYALIGLFVTLGVSLLWFYLVERRFMPKRLEVVG